MGELRETIGQFGRCWTLFLLFFNKSQKLGRWMISAGGSGPRMTRMYQWCVLGTCDKRPGDQGGTMTNVTTGAKCPQILVITT